MPCLRRISTGCLERSRSRRWRCMPLPRPGCIRTLRPLCSMERMRTNRRRPGRPGRPMAIAKTAAVEYSEGRGAQEELRFVVVHASQLAQQHAQAYAAAQAKEAAAVADHVKYVHAQWFACEADAAAAIAAYEGRGQGRRGRCPRP